MTAGSVDPVLVLAVGNRLLSDDGLGMVLLDELSRDRRWGEHVEFVDGGTQGLALLGRLGGRRAVVLLDAVALGAAPGTVHVQFGVPFGLFRSGTAHEANAVELLRYAALLGDLPDEVAIVGIEPASLETGIGLSDAVSAAIPEAVERAAAILSDLFKEEHSHVPCAAG